VVTTDVRGYATTREDAMADFKARWLICIVAVQQSLTQINAGLLHYWSHTKQWPFRWRNPSWWLARIGHEEP
jgi:hypothetical protein